MGSKNDISLTKFLMSQATIVEMADDRLNNPGVLGSRLSAFGLLPIRTVSLAKGLSTKITWDLTQSKRN